MNFTPEELNNLIIKKKFKGYNKDQVDEILDKVMEDYYEFIRMNQELKNRMEDQKSTDHKEEGSEESIRNILLVAQQTAQDMKMNADSKAENIIKDAELRALKILDDANQKVISIRYEYEELKKNLLIYKSKSELLLTAQLETLKQMSI